MYELSPKRNVKNFRLPNRAIARCIASWKPYNGYTVSGLSKRFNTRGTATISRSPTSARPKNTMSENSAASMESPPNVPAPADGHRPGLDSPGLRPVAVEDRFFADHGPRADGEEIGADRHAPGQDQRAGPDFRAQRLEIERVYGRADEQTGGRARPNERLDDPEADVRQAPQPDALGLPAADEQPLCGDRRGADREERRTAREDQSQVDRGDSRARQDPLVALFHGAHGHVAIAEKEERLQRTAEDVLPRVGRRRRLDRQGGGRRRGALGRHLGERRRQTSDRRMRVHVLHRDRRQVSSFPHPRAEV